MSWRRPPTTTDSRQKMAHLVESPGFTLPLNPDGEPAVRPFLSRLLQGPTLVGGELCDVLPGQEAVVLVSPSGEKILMQNEGKATFHVPEGWRLMVGSLPLRATKNVKRRVRVGDTIQKIESSQTVLHSENISDLYQEADLANFSQPPT